MYLSSECLNTPGPFFNTLTAIISNNIVTTAKKTISTGMTLANIIAVLFDDVAKTEDHTYIRINTSLSLYLHTSTFIGFSSIYWSH